MILLIPKNINQIKTVYIMKTKTTKMNLKKATIVNLNRLRVNAIRGGSSIPTDSVRGESEHIGETDNVSFVEVSCDSHGW